jgi:hypothetical protein
MELASPKVSRFAAANFAIAHARNSNSTQGGRQSMPQFNPELVQVMRNVLDEVMTRVPRETANTTTKAYLAECILKAAAQGRTSYNELIAAAADQVQAVAATFS